MKKEQLYVYFPSGKSIILNVMRLAFLLFFTVSFGFTPFSGLSQNAKVNLKTDKTLTIDEIFDLIEEQTSYRFVYPSNLIKDIPKINVKEGTTTVKNLLSNSFLDIPVDYEFRNKKNIVLTKAVKNTVTDVEEEQQQTITGTVTDEDGIPLPGVNITVEGTTRGTQTDFDGKYTIEVEKGISLVFSFVGFEDQTIVVGDDNSISIIMKESTSALDEVVVTALGIKRQAKSLTYSTQNVDIESMNEVRPRQNLVQALQGKVAGLSMISTGTGVSGESRVNLRGNRSIDGSSQPLYVVDGVPIGQDISDISPDDVASISVLKGGNAAALYGSRANNGAIIITTKTGGINQLSLDLNIGMTFEKAKVLYDYQNEYGQGVEGSYYNNGEPLSGSLESWGQKLDGSLIPHWSPDPNKRDETYPYEANPSRFKDFLNTGHTNTYSLSARSGTETSQLYFGYTFDHRKGVMPGNEMRRHNASLRLNQKFFDDRLILDTKLNYIRSDIYNENATGGNFENPWLHFYQIPPNIRDRDLREFEYVSEEGKTLQNFWQPGSNGGSNVYWVANRNVNNQSKDRVLSHASLEYNFSDKFKLMARTAFETASRFYESKFYNDTYIIGPNGEYSTESNRFYDWNSDFLLSYNDNISAKFKYNINFGGNTRQVRSQAIGTLNNGLAAPNIFSLSNALQPEFSQRINRKNVQSLYGFGQVSYDNAIFLDLTYRNDWSSTLPKENWSFGYYSAGLSAVISDLLDFNDNFFNYLKLRGSYAQVGNDPEAFRLDRTAELRPGGLIYLSQTLPNSNLKAEKTISSEIGFDARFFNSRMGVDFTYYSTSSTDQLFTQDVPLGSGVRHRFLNGARIQNSGIEIILSGTPIDTEFRWDINLNFSKNRSKIKELAEGIDRLAFGSSAYGIRNFQLVVGSDWGDQYSRGYLRDDENRIIVDSRGLPKTTSGKTVPVANFNPDWISGMYNSFSYKNIDLSFLIDYRKGGTVLSETMAQLSADGLLKSTLEGRDGSLIVGKNVLESETVVKEDGTPNDIEIQAEDFWKYLGKGEQPVGEAFVESATNIRLRELSVGYNLPKNMLENTVFRDVKFSLVGSNLFFLYNSASFDPEVSVGSGIADEGFDSFAPPLIRSFGFNVKVRF